MDAAITFMSHYSRLGRIVDFPPLDRERILQVSELFFKDHRAIRGSDRAICIDEMEWS